MTMTHTTVYIQNEIIILCHFIYICNFICNQICQQPCVCFDLNSLYLLEKLQAKKCFDKYQYCKIDSQKNRLSYGIWKIWYLYFPITKIVDNNERGEKIPLQDDDSLSYTLIHEKLSCPNVCCFSRTVRRAAMPLFTLTHVSFSYTNLCLNIQFTNAKCTTGSNKQKEKKQRKRQ